MTAKEILRRIFDILDTDNDYFFAGTATGGSANTVIDTSASPDSDLFSNYEYEIEMLSGDAAGERRTISSFSSNTWTAKKDFSTAISSGDTYMVGPAGFWSAGRVIKWLIDEINDLKQSIIDEAFFQNVNHATTSGVAISGKVYGETTLPANFIRALKVYIGGKPAKIVRQSESRMFYRDSYIGRAVLIGSGIRNTSSKKAQYRPKDNATLTWVSLVTSTLAVNDTTIDTIPIEMQTILIDKVVARCFRQLPEGQALAKEHDRRAMESIKVHNIKAIELL